MQKRYPSLISLSVFLALASGCTTTIEDTTSTTAGPPVLEYDGVIVICDNPADGDFNYWYPGVDAEHETCTITVDGVPKVYDPCPDAFRDSVQLCIGEVNPDGSENTEFNLDDWEDSLENMEAEILTACSVTCASKSTFPGQWPDPVCDDAKWNGISEALGWDPADGFNCHVPYERNVDDPDGSSIQWPPTGASEPVLCDLDYSCCAEFVANICQFIEAPEVGVITAGSRLADYKGDADLGTQLAFDMPGSGAGVDDTEPLTGFAEYSASECGDDACPFYLANLSASNTVDTWDINLRIRPNDCVVNRSSRAATRSRKEDRCRRSVLT